MAISIQFWANYTRDYKKLECKIENTVGLYNVIGLGSIIFSPCEKKEILFTYLFIIL